MTGSYFGGRSKLDTVMFFSKMEHSIGKQGWLWEFEWMGFISVRCSDVIVKSKLRMAARKLAKSLKRTWEKFIRRNAMRN